MVFAAVAAFVVSFPLLSGLALAGSPPSKDKHVSEALEHAKEAVTHGKQGHADALVEHARESLKHAEAADMKHPALADGIVHL